MAIQTDQILDVLPTIDAIRAQSIRRSEITCRHLVRTWIRSGRIDLPRFFGPALV
jgi:hypothetical protein